MSKGFTVENQQLNAWLDKIDHRSQTAADGVKTLTRTITSLETSVSDVEAAVGGDIDGGAAASVFTTEQVLDGGGA